MDQDRPETIDNTPTPAGLERYRQRFGPDWYVFHHGGCRFVVGHTVTMVA